MRTIPIIAAIAGLGAAALFLLMPSEAERRQPSRVFDPLFASGANCAPAQTGRPVLLTSLLQAQGQRQPRLPYMEPPYWYYSTRQSLGVALLRAGQVDEAEEVFRASLARTPGNGWALRGLIEV